MLLKTFDDKMSVCLVDSYDGIDLTQPFCFTAATDEELSLVCLTEQVPSYTIKREDGWRMFRIEGELDFSLIGILSKISSILADHHIGLFAVSTYKTDYILVKENDYSKAIEALREAGYTIV